MYIYEIKVNAANEVNETNTNENTNTNNTTTNNTNTNKNAFAQQLILKKYFYSIVLLKNIPILYEKLNFIKHHIRKIADSYILTQTIASELYIVK